MSTPSMRIPMVPTRPATRPPARSPASTRYVVVGVMGSLAYAAGPLGLILAGPLADAAGLHATFLALALPMLAIGVIAVFLPALRDLDRTPDS